MTKKLSSYEVNAQDTVGLEYRNIIKLRDFSVKKKRTVCLSMPWRMRYSTSSMGYEAPRFCIMVDPCGYGEEAENYVSVFLRLLTCDKPTVNVKYAFFIINENDEKTHITGCKIETFGPGDAKGYPRFVKRDVLLNEAYGLLPNDVLTIFYEASFVDDTINISEQTSTMRPMKLPDREMYENLGLSFENKEFGDVTLVAGRREFQAHKMLLAENSSVFAAMFDHDMVEQKQNRVDITDINSEVLEEMLRFIYTGKVTNLEKIAAELVVAADKYDIDMLKDMSSKALSRTIEIENAADIFIIAYLHSIEPLKADVINFINTYTKNVMCTEAFHSLIHSHAYLFAEIFPVAVMTNLHESVDSSSSSKELARL